jgi:hypothetical protein
MSVAAAEVAVHGWDVACAYQRLGPIPHALATVALANCFPGAGSIVRGGLTHVDEKLKSGTVSVAVGTRLELTLHSDLWAVQGSSEPRVHTPLGRPAYPASGPKCSFPAAEDGCGTVAAWFTALKPGKAVITATRASYGEAMRCGADQSTY